MSRGPETTFIQSVHYHLPDTLYRMKNHNEYNSGIADVWYSDDRDLWVEYKFLVPPKNNDTIIEFCAKKKNDWGVTPLQLDWLNSRYDEGRSVWVIVGCKEGGIILKDKLWEAPMSAGLFRTKTRKRSELAEELVTFLCRGVP